MANNSTLPATGDVIRDIDKGGPKSQVVVIDRGGSGTEDLAPLDGTDITTPTAMPTGGVGIRGWLSAIWTKLNASIAVTGTFFQATQPVSIAGTVTTNTGLTQPLTDTQLRATAVPVSMATNTPDVTDRVGRLLGVIASITGALPTGTNTIGSVNVVSSQGNVAAVSQAITATIADAPGVVTTTSGSGQAIANVQVSGNSTFHLLATAFVGTVVFEASLNGGANYAPIIAIREDGTGAEASTAISTAAAFIRTYTVGLPGFTHFRVRCSAFTSGSLAVYITQGPFLLEPNPSLAASTASIGTVVPRASDQFVTVTAAAASAATLTLAAPGAGLFHYITSLHISRTATAALAGTATLVITSTNIPGSPAWSVGNAMVAGGTQNDLVITFSSPVKVSAANTATTIVAPAPGAAVLWRINATYFIAA